MKYVQLSLLLLAFLSGCGLETKTLEKFYNDDLYEVTKITIVDGNTGESATSTDQEKIKLLMDDIRNIEFIPDEDQSKRDGFNYSITFYQDEKKVFQFGVNEINGNSYHTKPDITPVIDDFYSFIKEEEN